MMTVVVTFRMPVGLRRHFEFSWTSVLSSWVAEERGESYEGAAVHGFHEETSPPAGSPAFNKFLEGFQEECLLTKMSL